LITDKATLHLSTTGNRKDVIQSKIENETVQDIVDGQYITCITTNENVYTFGENGDGQLLHNKVRKDYLNDHWDAPVDFKSLKELGPSLHLPYRKFKVAVGTHNTYIYIVQEKPTPIVINLCQLHFADILITCRIIYE
jgi:hypothetical protein